ncbi:MAG: hypothetical protein ABMB14_23930 [Myxococcota bacterium]
MNPALDAVARTRPELARLLDAGWQTPIAAWSAAELWGDPPTEPGFEPAFRRALCAELAPRLGDATDRLVAAIEATGAVATPHHVCPTNGPTFGAIDRIACAGAPGPVLALAWSGVPMSNTAWSGALCFRAAQYHDLLRPGPELSRQRQAAKDRERDGVTERRVLVIPPELRDALVYGCPLPARVREVVAAATPALTAVLPDPTPTDDFPSWALRVCEGLERALVGRSDLYYVDLNRVAARYLAEVLADPAHPVSRLAARGAAGIDDLSWFYARRPGKRESVETLYGWPPDARERLAGGLCPGLVPVFGALRLLSRIRLLGGFRQVEYLERIARAWLDAGVVDADRGVPGRPITGRLAAYPLDVALGAVDRATLPGPDAPMSAVWEPILARLAG